VRILFIHQNAPGQFRHLAPSLARRPGNDVVFLGERRRQSISPSLRNVRALAYQPPPNPGPQTHRYLRRAESSVRRGQEVARTCLRLRTQGFDPDLVIAHPGWGETLFLREVLPRAAILSYCEMFYRAEGQDTGYVPETAIDLDGKCRIRTWNADLLTSLDVMDHGLSPTSWQRDQHPQAYRSNITVIHDGVDTDEVAPRPSARFQVPNGPCFTHQDEVLTFVARDLEPVRGFTLLMRALPDLLRLRPEAHVLICGGDGVSYGRPPPGGQTWRDVMLRENPVDPGRVHFVGKLPRPAYLDLLGVSALHLYLTVPFVLSWSCVEALAAGCLLLGSDVAPVREVIEDGINGFLVDARDPAAVARRAAELLEHRLSLGAVGRTAREHALARFDVRDCLAAQTRLIDGIIR